MSRTAAASLYSFDSGCTVTLRRCRVYARVSSCCLLGKMLLSRFRVQESYFTLHCYSFRRKTGEVSLLDYDFLDPLPPG